MPIFQHALNTLLYKLSDPTHAPEIMHYVEGVGYELPESVQDWGKMILTGRARGRILPKMMQYSRSFTGEERKSGRQQAIQEISQEIASASFGDSTWRRVIDWFGIAQRDDLPESSLLDLYCTALRGDSLVKLAFQLYCDPRYEDKNLLMRKLRNFSDDLAFQWYWVLPELSKLMPKMNSFITDLDNTSVMTMIISWAMKQPNPNECLANYERLRPKVLWETIQGFDKWMRDLCGISMEEVYCGVDGDQRELTSLLIGGIISGQCVRHEDVEHQIDTKQPNLHRAAEQFFRDDFVGRWGDNENWMRSRVKIMAEHLRGENDLFERIEGMSERIRGQIRRSLVYCHRMTQPDFIFELNQSLSRLRK